MARRLLVVAGVAGVVALALAAGGRAQGDPDPAAAVADLQTRVAALEERLAARPLGTVEAGGSLRFEGEGAAVSEPFPLRKGTTLYTVELAGGGAGRVALLPAPGTGQAWDVDLVRGAAPFSGTVARSLGEDAEAVLAVEASGPWSVTVEQ